jgi:hypothetical protein
MFEIGHDFYFPAERQITKGLAEMPSYGNPIGRFMAIDGGGIIYD